MSTRYVWAKQQIKTIYQEKQKQSVLPYELFHDFTFSRSYRFDSDTGYFYNVDITANYRTNQFYEGYSTTIPVSDVGRYIIYHNASSFWDYNVFYCGPNVTHWILTRTTSNIKIECSDKSYLYVGYGEKQEALTTVGYVSSNSRSGYTDNSTSGGYKYVYQGSDNVDPSTVTYSTTTPQAGQSITISVTPRTPIYPGTIYYQYYYSTNGGSSWTAIGSKTTLTSTSVTIPAGATQFMARVLTSDNLGFTSTTYVTGANLTIQTAGGDNFIGIGGTARQIDKIYIGIGGTAREVTEGYIGIGGTARKFYG